MLLRHIGVAYMKPAKLHKVGAMEFKAPESCCHSNYIYIFIRGCYLYTQASIQALFSTVVFSPKIEFL